MTTRNRNNSGYCKGTECDKGMYDSEQECFRGLQQLLFLSLQVAWRVSVCLSVCLHSYLAPPKHPTSLMVAPLLPVAQLHHSLDRATSLSRSILLPHPWAPGRLLPWLHYNSGHILLISVPMAHCRSVSQCQVKNSIDPAWLSEPASRM